MDAALSEEGHVEGMASAATERWRQKMHAPQKLDPARIDDRSLSAGHQQALVRLMTREAHAAPARVIRARFRRLLLRLGNAMTSAGNAILQLANHPVAALARWQRNQQAMAALAAMSDRNLKDLGVHRSDIYWAVNYGRQDRPGSMRGKGGSERGPNPISARPQTTCGRPQAVKVTGRAA
jgi:uncharacterized protein YjiS (DUF1127 family)